MHSSTTLQCRLFDHHSFAMPRQRVEFAFMNNSMHLPVKTRPMTDRSSRGQLELGVLEIAMVLSEGLPWATCRRPCSDPSSQTRRVADRLGPSSLRPAWSHQEKPLPFPPTLPAGTRRSSKKLRRCPVPSSLSFAQVSYRAGIRAGWCPRNKVIPFVTHSAVGLWSQNDDIAQLPLI